ncbi:MAG: 16S rRNA (cytosine(1402)-N(4))-methyltransferase RsmH [Lachnospiraceae bacterium]|nr:16S rRNA (cytosine(1402)-N(4))-methyltransferase RsmH [Lachnospiraceae bacterium]MBQ4308449.1 16S rRNA (cytosine(1402)-N(4))-methyltransferase RsmH [Lachnospiraceae bacterium]MBR2738589.1 16S rRNA (cytosine(1402)-N(4))-methyltransferase RsmH [Lachnospiraceae bacterium]MCR5539165.1 16S rRNA (cytosine(1402)-N(4))-methyltransferase RsmH [Lachnospiraceae bacterium]
MSEFSHVSVLRNEAVEALKIFPGGVYLDGTAGGGGHSYEIASRLGAEGRLISLDRDEAAVAAASARLADFPNAEVVRANYENFDRVLDERGIALVDGILLDIGVSSPQIDEAERGFSYMHDGPLDMRMDRDESLSAADIIADYPADELTRIFREYGEERFAKRIADRIVREREKAPIGTTLQLAKIVEQAVPAAKKRDGHPAKRVFQALRIECNRELDILSNTVDRMIGRLAPGGRLAIITFHSLEDRIVKQAFRTQEDPCTCPPDFPVCVCGKVSAGRVVTRKPVVPTEEECKANPRAASAKLRVFEKKQQ